MGARVFTVEEANRLLPRLRELLGRLPSAPDSPVPARAMALAGNGSAAGAARDARIRSTTAAVLAALQELGVVVRDLASGLIDFPSERDGQPVFLCWRLGEPLVAHWHDDSSGFTGRRPL